MVVEFPRESFDSRWLRAAEEIAWLLCRANIGGNIKNPILAPNLISSKSSSSRHRGRKKLEFTSEIVGLLTSLSPTSGCQDFVPPTSHTYLQVYRISDELH